MLETVCHIAYAKSPRTLSLIIPEARFPLVYDYAQKERGRVLAATFRRWIRKRSQGGGSQNNAIHGFAQQIAEYTGEDMDRIKFWAKRRAFKRGYPPKHSADGAIILSPIDGEPIPESSAVLNTSEAGYLIDELIMIAGELDIHLRGLE